MIATGLALGVAVVPLTTTRASSPSPHAEPLPLEADPSAEVRELYELGMVRFEATEYDEALVVWKLAFELAAHDLGQQATRAVLVANIVAANNRAYEGCPDVAPAWGRTWLRRTLLSAQWEIGWLCVRSAR